MRARYCTNCAGLWNLARFCAGLVCGVWAMGPAGFASKSLARDDRPAFRPGAYPIQYSLARSLDGCLGRIPGVRMKRVSRLTILAEVEAEEAASPNLEVSP